MTQEKKSLLLKDLCARLPYNCRVFYEYIDDLDGKTYGYSLTLNTWCIDEFVANKAVIRPHLRSMSSMTEEEKNFWKITHKHHCKDWEYVDWLNAHYLDYRRLIDKGLALEAPEGMYK